MSDFTPEQQKALAMASARKRMAANQESSSAPDQSYPGEETFRNIGRVGRTALEGPIKGITDLADLAGKGINKVAGTQIEPWTPKVTKAFDKSGYFPVISEKEKPVQDAMDMVSGSMLGGDGLVNIGRAGAKEAARLGAPVAKKALEVGGQAAKGVGEAVGSRVKDVKTGFSARGHEELDAVASKMRSSASKTIKEAYSMGAVLKNDAIRNIVTKIGSGLDEVGLLNKRLHGDTLSVVNDLKAAAKTGKVSLEKLEQHRQLLRDVIRKNTSKIDGANPEVPMAQAAIKAIDSGLNELKDTDFAVKFGDKSGVGAIQKVRQFREEWSRARRFEHIADMVQRAKGDASKMKDEFGKFVGNKNNLAGFSDKEKEALISFSKRGVKDKALTGLGQFGFNPAKKNFNAFVPGLETVAGLYHAPYTAPLTAAGTAANLYRNYLTKGQAENILNLIQGIKP